MKLKYKSGNYPNTMQMYFDKYDDKLYKEIFNAYKVKYSLDKEYSYKFSERDKFYLNFTAYLILNEKNEVVDSAFEQFSDFIWILSLLNIDGLEFEVPDSLPEIDPDDFNYFSSRFEKC